MSEIAHERRRSPTPHDRRASVAAPRLLAVIGALSCLGCGASARPAGIAEWQSCIVAPGAIAGTDAIEVVPKPGRAVWHARAEWGRSPVRSEYQAGDLLVELPEELVPGATLQIDKSARALYREGGEAVIYQVDGLEGTITIESVSAGGATFHVDLHGPPTRDVAQRGELRLNGTIDAKRRARLTDCR